MKTQIERVFSNLDDNVDAFLISNGAHPNLDLNFFYVSGITSGVFEGCTIVAKRDGKSYLMTSELEEPIARKETNLEILTFKTREERREQLKRILSGVKKLGINANTLSYKQYSNISELTKAKIEDISDAFSAARSIKNKKEIRLISKACKISAKVADKFPSYIRNNITEKQLSKVLIDLQFDYGATNLAFSPPIVAFGKNSSRPHHTPTDMKLKRNQFVLIDFGAEYNRYTSDISRTFVFGKPDKKMKDIYETVLNAQTGAIDMVKDGANGKDIDNFARKMIDKKYKGSFIHSLGHEVGLAIHDGKTLTPNADFILKENMVVTIEPGIYIPSIGGVRIEDTVIVTKGKPKILTAAKKNLVNL
ncbi:MAG: aminopeptidase P family protein [Candidatus Aenigmarchaeota archaeon]|nr:aminopeptidase P family protein [Candidatus Aenigmarchaeota archaeon]